MRSRLGRGHGYEDTAYTKPCRSLYSARNVSPSLRRSMVLLRVEVRTPNTAIERLIGHTRPLWGYISAFAVVRCLWRDQLTQMLIWREY